MQDTKKLIGSRIKALRRQAGLTQEDLAGSLPLDPRHLSRIEVGRHFPTVDTLDRLAAVLNVPIAEFFTFADQESVARSRAFLKRFVSVATPNQVRSASIIIKALVA